MKPVNVAYVKLWGDIAGAMFWHPEMGYAVFEYDPGFLKKGLDLSPIHMGLEEARRGTLFRFPNEDRHTFHGLPGLLASGLPDTWGNKIIDAWLDRMGRDVKTFNPVERLCYIGTRGMGALEFDPQIGPSNLDQSVPVEVENLMALVQEVMTQRTRIDARLMGPDEKKAEALLDILRIGTSAGGQVPKAIIAMNPAGHTLSGQSAHIPPGYDHWILKFDGVSEENPDAFGQPLEKGRIEYAYYLMATSAGIDMMTCRLLEENGRAHFLTKRFDRIDGEKVHVLSLACMAHFGWNPPGAYGYENAFAVMRQLGLDYPSMAQQYRRMVFNALTKNLDDHTKNISYTMGKDGVWKLSPAYDLIFSYNPDDLLGDRHKMTINGKQSQITDADFLAVADAIGINKPQTIIDELREVVSQWPVFADQAGVNKKLSLAIGEAHQMDEFLFDIESFRV